MWVFGFFVSIWCMATRGNYLLSGVLERKKTMAFVWEYERYYGMGRIACKPFQEIRIETKVADKVSFGYYPLYIPDNPGNENQTLGRMALAKRQGSECHLPM